MQKQGGFTLIETIVTIVVLGVLAISALPMYTNMQRDARIAAVNGLLGAVRSADTLVSTGVIAKGLNSQPGSATVYPNGSAVAGDTKVIRIYGGHPDAQLDGIGNALQGANIGFGNGYNNAGVTSTYGPFAVRWSPNNVWWEYARAPNPSSCMVNYRNGGISVLITATTSGC